MNLNIAYERLMSYRKLPKKLSPVLDLSVISQKILVGLRSGLSREGHVEGTAKLFFFLSTR